MAAVFAAGAFGQKAESFTGERPEMRATDRGKARGGRSMGEALCGAPQPIYGVVSVERFGMRLPVSTRVELRTFEGDLLAVTLSNPFGWYEFADVLPCQDYSVRAMHKRLVFAPSPVLAAEFDGKGVRRDVFEIVAETIYKP